MRSRRRDRGTSVRLGLGRPFRTQQKLSDTPRDVWYGSGSLQSLCRTPRTPISTPVVLARRSLLIVLSPRYFDVPTATAPQVHAAVQATERGGRGKEHAEACDSRSLGQSMNPSGVLKRDLQEHTLARPLIPGTIHNRPPMGMFQTWKTLPFGSLNRRPPDLDHTSVTLTGIPPGGYLFAMVCMALLVGEPTHGITGLSERSYQYTRSSVHT
ncbi:hypothetical protein KC316_g19 [Hortaea werneckii]|nr:hypothetical protein KC316_g19 [Hortaea werneckii]